MVNTIKPKKEKKLLAVNRRKEKRISLKLPAYSLGEEIFSAVSHGVAALTGVAELVLLLIFCRREAISIVSAAVYGGSTVLLFTVSTLYHALGINRAKKVFRSLDHCTIFLLIAGTYTPITLVSLGGNKGLIMFLVVCLAAVLGIVFNAISVERFAKLSMVSYIAMGWVIVFAMKDFYLSAGKSAFIFLLIGGIIYTAGAALYLAGKKVPYMHSVWHIFVFAGSFMHFLCVWNILV